MSRGISKKMLFIIFDWSTVDGRMSAAAVCRVSIGGNCLRGASGSTRLQMKSSTFTTEKPGLWGGWDPIFWHRLMPVFAESNALLRHSWKCVGKEIASIPEGTDAIFRLEEKNSSSLIPVNYLASSEATKRTLTTPHSSGAASIVKVVATSPKIGSSFSSTLESRTGVSSDVVPSLAIFTTL